MEISNAITATVGCRLLQPEAAVTPATVRSSGTTPFSTHQRLYDWSPPLGSACLAKLQAATNKKIGVPASYQPTAPQPKEATVLPKLTEKKLEALQARQRADTKLMNGMIFPDGEEAGEGTDGMVLSFQQPCRSATELVASLPMPDDQTSAFGEAHGLYARNQLAQTSHHHWSVSTMRTHRGKGIAELLVVEPS